MRHLYLVRIGERLKVGTTMHLDARIGAHRRTARRAGLPFDVLLTLPAHEEADANERAVLARFGTRGSLSEHLTADPHEVAEFILSLPCTTASLPERTRETEQWIDRPQAAQMLGCSLPTLHRWVASGQLPAYKNSITKRVRFRIEDVQRLAEMVA